MSAFSALDFHVDRKILREAKMSPKMLLFLCAKYWKNVVKILTHRKSVTVPTCKTLLWSLLRRCQFYPDHHHHHQPCSSPSHISVSKHPDLSLSDGAFSPSKSSLYNISKYFSRKYQISLLRNQEAGCRAEIGKIGKKVPKSRVCCLCCDNSCLCVILTVPDAPPTAIIAKTENMARPTLVISPLFLS